MMGSSQTADKRIMDFSVLILTSSAPILVYPHKIHVSKTKKPLLRMYYILPGS